MGFFYFCKKQLSMKHLVTCIAFLFISSAFFAQSKTAHINYSQLVLLMPETAEADKALNELTKQYEEQLQKLSQAYNEKMEAFKQEEESLAGAMRELREKELKDLETTYQNFLTAAKKEIAERDKELFAPIFEKAKKAVTEVAKSKGYAYVIDSSKDNYVYMDPKDDIMDLVKKKLGL